MYSIKNPIRRLVWSFFDRRVLPYWCILILDTVIVMASFLFSYGVVNGASEIVADRWGLVYSTLLFAGLSWIGTKIFRTYSGVVRYSSFVDLLKVTLANLLTFAVCTCVSLVAQWRGIDALSVFTVGNIAASMLVATFLQWVVRVVVKLLFDNINAEAGATRAIIYGALTGGVGLAKNIRTQRPVQFNICGFITHEHHVKNMQLLGLPVYTLEEDIAAVIRKRHIEAVIVSPLRVNEFRENQAIQDVIISCGCKIYMSQQAREARVRDGKLSDEEESQGVQLHEVSVEDLLPRSQIQVDMKSVGEQLSGRRVLVTGSAGSIGSEIVRQVASFGPSAMMLIDQAETPQHDLRLMMAKDFPSVKAEIVVTSVDRRTRMEYIFEHFRPEYVFHAAAYKHVPMMEDNPSEAVLNNLQSTRILADLSVKYGARKFVMISTDKSVNPTNVMGCSKRICEIYVQSLDRKLKLEALSNLNGNKNYTQFVTTRFGNVLGSNGSVIPLFREQIKRGGPVTVTDENIVRFFMLIPEACKLVLEAGTKGQGGEIFVFDMGKPVRIADLAKRMIALSGARDVKIEYTGLRDGEKLYEEVLSDMENTKPTFHPKIRIASVREYDYDEVCRELDELVEIAKRYDNMETVRKMKQIVPEYRSNNSVYEKLDKELSVGVNGLKEITT